ncbi:2-dehydropantoate 2-reductase N-terminal domain-containing protein [Curtobacterium sp. MCBD17_035]|uniref:ketopantoate reductase family protein n=1 Tax=unclassified Curtobacterium TaxID=257496 RepID=UPI001C65471E|nr:MULTISPECIES: 2-dehydropantoate 2-reductase N-terminal domain-containing protein [unclassified Curtobacterium]WIB68134.1 2-dehydropantoate 2-reductase N-terminal domain-containing protein [Curtobacterium sp. MCBD17_035]
MTTDRTTTIVGAGAIGGTLAVHLDAAGVPVQLVDADPAHVAAIRERGLTLLTPDGATTAHVPAYTLEDAPDELGRVLLAVKALATDAAAAWIAPRLRSDGFVASLQNGLNEATIAGHVGVDRTVIAFVDLFADVMEPGVVKDGGHGGMALGEFAGGTSDRVRDLAADLAHWGSPVVSANVEGFLWSKLGFGAMLTATALADDDMSDLIDRNRAVMTTLAREVFDVADGRGIALEPFDAFDPQAFRSGADPATTERALDDLVAWLATQSKTRSGIWRDIAVRHRRTEVPAHYRPVVAMGAAQGVALPAIEALITAIVRLEEGESAMDEAAIAALAPSTVGEAR